MMREKKIANKSCLNVVKNASENASFLQGMLIMHACLIVTCLLKQHLKKISKEQHAINRTKFDTFIILSCPACAVHRCALRKAHDKHECGCALCAWSICFMEGNFYFNTTIYHFSYAKFQRHRRFLCQSNHQAAQSVPSYFRWQNLLSNLTQAGLCAKICTHFL